MPHKFALSHTDPSNLVNYVLNNYLSVGVYVSVLVKLCKNFSTDVTIVIIRMALSSRYFKL